MNTEVKAMMPNKTTTNNGKVIVTYAVNPYQKRLAME